MCVLQQYCMYTVGPVWAVCSIRVNTQCDASFNVEPEMCSHYL